MQGSTLERACARAGLAGTGAEGWGPPKPLARLRVGCVCARVRAGSGWPAQALGAAGGSLRRRVACAPGPGARRSALPPLVWDGRASGCALVCHSRAWLRATPRGRASEPPGLAPTLGCVGTPGASRWRSTRCSPWRCSRRGAPPPGRATIPSRDRRRGCTCGRGARPAP